MSKKSNLTKKALISSAIALVLCATMLLGTTFAWFTDTATAGVNTIQSGTLDVDIVDEEGNSLEGQTLNFVKAAEAPADEAILWEPGATYKLQDFHIKNNGNLALKFKLIINGIDGDAKLLEAIDWTLKLGDSEQNIEEFAGELLPGAMTGCITISGTMRTDAGNEYQGLTAEGIGITVVATQLPYEYDSFGNQYDADADLWGGNIPETQPESLELTLAEQNNQGGTITIKDAEAFVYLNKLVEDFKVKAEEIPGYDNYYYHWAWDVELAADIDLFNIPVDSIQLSFFDKFNGNGHTISNVVIKDGGVALFDKGAVQDLNIANIVVNAPSANTVGSVVGTNAYLNNVHVVNATVSGNKYVGGLAGKGSSFINCSIKNSTVTATDKTVGGLVGYSIGDPNPATVSGNTVEKVTVIGAYNVGGLLGQAQNETVENNTVKDVTVISTTPLPADASSNEVRTGAVVARNVGATIGENTAENVTLQND